MSGEISWYVVRGKEQAGPFTDEQFRAYAENGELKPDDQVWRPGFEAWQRAADVPGLLQPPKIVSPPPPQPLPPASAQTPALEKETGAQAAEPDPKLVGVRGWLLLLCVGLTIFGPLFATAETIRGYDEMRALFSTVAGFKSFYDALVALTVIQILASFCVGVMLWSRQPGAPKLAQWFLLANIALVCVAPFLIYLFVNMPTGSGESVLKGALPEIIRSAGPSLIWYWYLEKSRRVRATFSGF